MAGVVQFNRNYAEFGNKIRPFEKADDVGFVLTQILWDYNYPAGSLIDSHVSSIWLGEGESPDPDTIDLIFKMRPFDWQPDGVSYFEIILRSASGPAYGGWAEGDQLVVTDEVVNGLRVLETTYEGSTLRWAYNLGRGWYEPVDNSLSVISNLAIRSVKK